MGLVPVTPHEEALDTLRELMFQGFAGLDEYDDSRFVIDAPEPFLSDGERALADLGGHMLKTGAGASALLPLRVWLELGLDSRDAPRLIVPLASRRVA